MIEPRLRQVETADHARLRELTLESKAHWGYDRDLVRSWAGDLSFESDEERWVAEVDGAIVAWAGLIRRADGVAVLDDLWVEPRAMGLGIGSRLFRLAADRARELDAERLEWGAEPNARGFYEKMGGQFLRNYVTEWGREGRWYGMEL